MMNLWNPYAEDSRHIAFDVTEGPVSGIRDGTRELIEECLDKLSVDAELESWRIDRYRTQYFSDYLDPEESWVDRWQRALTITATVRSNTVYESELVHAWVEASGTDSTASSVESPPEKDDVACLIFCSRAHEAEVTDLAAEMAKAIPGAQGTFAIRTLADLPPPLGFGRSLLQARVRWSNVVFPDVVAPLDELMRRCQDAGHFIQWRQVVAPR